MICMQEDVTLDLETPKFCLQFGSIGTSAPLKDEANFDIVEDKVEKVDYNFFTDAMQLENSPNLVQALKR